MTRVTLLTAIYSDVCLRKLRLTISQRSFSCRTWRRSSHSSVGSSCDSWWCTCRCASEEVPGQRPLLQRGCLMSHIHMRLHASIGYTPITAFHSQRRWCVSVLMHQEETVTCPTQFTFCDLHLILQTMTDHRQIIKGVFTHSNWDPIHHSTAMNFFCGEVYQCCSQTQLKE